MGAVYEKPELRGQSEFRRSHLEQVVKPGHGQTESFFFFNLF